MGRIADKRCTGREDPTSPSLLVRSRRDRQLLVRGGCRRARAGELPWQHTTRELWAQDNDGKCVLDDEEMDPDIRQLITEHSTVVRKPRVINLEKKTTTTSSMGCCVTEDELVHSEEQVRIVSPLAVVDPIPSLRAVQRKMTATKFRVPRLALATRKT